MAIQTRFEKIFHNSIFDKLNGSILSTYNLSDIHANNEWVRLLAELQENHDANMICKDGKCILTVNTQ
jgi:hypothetical protein